MSASSLGLRALLLTSASLAAFAANSVICRMALEGGHIDPASYTLLRFMAGALVLMGLVRGRSRAAPGPLGWASALMLTVYGLAFAYAYARLGASTGALILFAAVQASMFLAGIAAGERVSGRAWTGLVLALGGLLALTAPGLSAPHPGAAALMALAGVAWGGYSLLGRRSTDPVAGNAAGFVIAVPMTLLCLPLLPGDPWLTPVGVFLAILAGGLASALGYVAWYAALKHLTATRAAVLQLLVPALAALGGVVWLDEDVSPRLVWSFLAVIAGNLLFLLPGRAARRQPQPSAGRGRVQPAGASARH